MKVRKLPRLTLLGAGPGDPELLTIKGVRALENADVVLYDALANPALLAYAPEAHCVFVGKRKGFKRYTQDEINQLIVDFAQSYGHVVRLKGGDSFMFGRGAEERDIARSHGIQVQVIPGISSAYGVPASQGISLTTRGVSQSVWVITGTTSNRSMSKDIVLAARSSATVVILMGMHKLAEIAQTFISSGRGDLPCAIIQNGTLPDSRSILGTMRSIVELRNESGLAAPAVIVVGDVALQLNEDHKMLEYLTGAETNQALRYGIPQ